jgi:amino acid adenylation domain-containing protein/thioester reductase-like protein
MDEIKGSETRTGLEVAVIGTAGKFPGAKNIHEFWNNLKNGVESITFFSAAELEETGNDHELVKNPNYVKAKGILPDIDNFDASFFSYTPKEAEIMDPQMRLFHECVWQALEDAGYDIESDNGRIGLYAGASSSFHWEALTRLTGENYETVDPFTASCLNNKDLLCMQISYKFNLKGPSFTLHTTCSTSLVAVHLAIQGLLNGECEIALAGGVSLSSEFNGKTGYLYQEEMIMSPDGHCRAFDAIAKGTIGGEGVGVVVLKLFEEAVTAGDNIYAIVKGSAINNDGIRKAGFTAPGVEGQAEVISAAMHMAEVEPESIGYIETHGTGTLLGDPIEIEALKLAFDTDKQHFCPIGSVKTNIGHLDTAAGIAGFIKTVLVLKHRLIPPSLHFQTPNQTIDFESSPFYVVTQPVQWKNDKYPFRAGVSSFGIGGTNAHVVLEEWPGDSESVNQCVSESVRKAPGGTRGLAPLSNRQYQLILLSAKTPTALGKMTENLAEYIKNNLLNPGNHENPINPGLTMADAAYTLQVGRKRFEHRKMLVCSTAAELIKELTSPTSIKTKSFLSNRENRSVIYMFPGQGSQYVNMGRELYETEPIFKEEIDRCFEILEGHQDYDIKEILYPRHTPPFGHPSQEGSRGGSPCPPSPVNSPLERGAPEGRGVSKPATSNLHLQPDINRTQIAQPVLFIFEYALAKLLMKWGIKPDAMMGHSIGEYVAAHLAGVFSLEDALKLVVLRGRLMQEMPPGGMLSVQLPEKEITSLLKEEISLAAVNGPSHCVVSGPHQSLENLARELKEKGCKYNRLHTSHAFHSNMMDPILKEFEKEVDKVTRNRPGIPYISNVTGNWIMVEQAADPGYWAAHLRETVYFEKGIAELLKEDDAIFVEVGPGKTLGTFVRQHTHRKTSHPVINLVKHPREDISETYLLLQKIGQLWLYGIKPDWSAFYARQERYRVSLPTYPFERQCFRKPAHSFKAAVDMRPGEPVLHKKSDIADWFYIPQWTRSMALPAERSHQATDTQAQPRWLIFTDRCGLGSRLVKRIATGNRRVDTVRLGAGFSKLSNREYTIRPGQVDDYNTLIDQLSADGRVPNRIVHLWGVTKKEETWEQEKDLGFYSLIHLAQALGRKGINTGIQVEVVTNNMHEVQGGELLYPLKAAVLGAVKIIPQEYININCFSIDILLPEPGSWREEHLIEQLLTEFTVKSPKTGREIAIRGNFRWERSYQQVRLGEKALPLEQGGIYLVTGGLGGIGYAWAKYLAEKAKAKLVLTGRNAKAEKRVRDLEILGAEVLVLRADAADFRQMQKTILKVEKQFGLINGVIHTAGVADYEGIIQERTRERTEPILAPKIKGTVILDVLLKDHPLDFFILCSSLSSILAPFGQVGYAAANAFLDSFALSKNKAGHKAGSNQHKHQCHYASINWDAWQKVGMAVEAVKRIGGDAGVILKDEILPEEGIEVFKRVIGNRLPRVLVSTKDLNVLIEQWNNQPYPGTNPSGTLNPRPGISAKYIAPTNDVEQKLANIWQDFFGIEEVGIHDDFYELGGDSLKAMTILAKIHKESGVQVLLGEFFKNPVIQGLAKYITNAKPKEHYSLQPVEKKEYYMLSSAQKRLYVLHQVELNSQAYNMQEVISLLEETETGKLEGVFKKLINRHESLRTSFAMIGNEPVQRIHDEVEFKIEYYDIKEVEVKVREEPSPGSEGTRGLAPLPIEPAARSPQPAAALINSFIRPFDLSRAPLLRAGLIKTNQNRGLLLLDMHHIITDGISQNILEKEFMALCGKPGEELARQRLQYKDFSEWQNKEKQKESLMRQESYWVNLLSPPDELPALSLPIDYPRPLIQSFAGHSLNFTLGEEETRTLKHIAKKSGTTLYMTLLAVFTILLSKLSGQEDIIVGTPTAGRRHSDIEQIIGMFVNTLAMRNYPAGEKTVEKFLLEVKKNTLEAFENQEYQFEDLVDRISVRRDTSRNPLFDVMFNLPNPPGYTGDFTAIAGQDPYDLQSGVSRFDMNLTAMDMGRQISCNLEYCTRLFKPGTIPRFIGYFRTILSVLSTKPVKTLKLSFIEIISEEEKEKILAMSRGMEAPIEPPKTIHRRFEEQAAKTPNHVALVGVHETHKKHEKKYNMSYLSYMSYKELNEKSNRLAHQLKAKGVQPDTIVGIITRRSIEMIIAILAILKAGGAYLPIDMANPRERKIVMLEDSQIKLLLTNDSRGIKHDISAGIEIIDLEDRNTFGEDRTNPRQINRSTDLLYVIYTSGSTGTPKGVMLEHGNLVNLIDHQYKYTNIEFSRVLQFAAISFDVSFQEIFSTLLAGGKLYLIDQETRGDIPRLLKVIEKNEIKTLFLPASFLKFVLSEEDYMEMMPGSIQHIVTAGEQVVLSGKFKEYLRKNKVYLHNHYGPTETHGVTMLTLEPAGELPDLPSIGKPIANTGIYILDRGQHLQIIGVPGELYIGGTAVGRGYLNNPELTNSKFQNTNKAVPFGQDESAFGEEKAHQLYQLPQIAATSNEKFLRGGLNQWVSESVGRSFNSMIGKHSYESLIMVPRPHTESNENQHKRFAQHIGSPRRGAPGRRRQNLYKTGDLARWRQDGNIEFIGRIDYQVKIRGFRVEPGEIETRLLNHPDIKEAVVLVREDQTGNKYLCAYIVSKRELSAVKLREHLLKNLPEYMIPSYFVPLDKIPLTPNRKVDRSALPLPGIKPGTGYTAPGTELEKKMAEIWRQVLGMGKDAIQIGIHDNFFELGGHSLKAAVLTSRLHKELEIEIPLGELFRTPTIKGISQYIKENARKDKFTPLKPVEEREYYELHPAQKRLYILQQMEAQGTSYNIPAVMTLEGDIESTRFEKTFLKLIKRHESLRTSFHMIEAQPVQKIHNDVEFEIENYQVEVKVKVEEKRSPLLEGTGGLAPLPEEPAAALISSFIRVFDLTRAPLLRVGLIKLETGKYILMIDMHHIITDGTSLGILIKEFMAIYPGEELPPLRIRFKDYAQWQNREKQKQEIKKQEAYWLKEFQEEIPVLDLPIDYARPGVQSFAGSAIHFKLEEKETQRLKKFALQEGVTLFMVLLALANILLSRLSSQEDIVMGTPVRGRRHTNLEEIIGMFVNTLALRNYPTRQKTFKKFLQEIKTNTLNAFENQDYPFEELVEKVPVNRDTGRNPFFDVMFDLQNLETPDLEIPGLKLKPYDFELNISKFDLELIARETVEGVSFTFVYCTELFKKKTIERFINYYKKIVSSILHNSSIKIAGIDIISEKEKKRLLYEFNDTKREYPADRTVHQLFEEQVKKTPDHIAVVEPHRLFEGTRGLAPLYITYRELNQKSNHLAHLLIEKGVKQDTIVGIMLERSIEMIIGILGILKAGGAYLPIAPDFPVERIDYMIKDSSAKILVTAPGLSEKFKKLMIVNCQLLMVNQKPPYCRRLNNPPKETNSINNYQLTINNSQLEQANLAYVIYTSGTTGKPKAVAVSHRNILRLVKNTNYITFNETQKILQTGALEFDVSTFEIWGPLLNGLSLYISTKYQILNQVTLKKMVMKYDITTMWMTSPLFNRMVQEDIEIFAGLQNLLVGGDVLSPIHINSVRHRYPGLKVINGYGPTENTTFSTTFPVDRDYNENIPIGKPIANSTAYIVDKDFHILPVGAAGELYVGGDGVARGYLNDPELTAEKFCLRRPGGTLFVKTAPPGPPRKNFSLFSPHSPYSPYSPIYRTGDLARWLQDGNIQFLGRIDHQVKIRGIRVELGEIENHLLKYTGIREAVVAAKKEELCAYIVPDNQLALPTLRDYLAKRLPAYMIPSYFVQLKEIPLTPNGKVDSKALPAPAITPGSQYAAPGNQIEKKLVKIWTEVLDRTSSTKIGIDDNFFELGGHSLRGTTLISSIHKVLNAKVSLSQLFKAPTIRKLSQYITTTLENKYTAVEPVEKKEYYSLSSAQKRMYFLQQMDETSTSYNMPLVLPLGKNIEINKLEPTIKQLIAQHESLRTSFIKVKEIPVQRVHDEVEFEIEYNQVEVEDEEGTRGLAPLSEEPAAALISSFIRPFDLSRSPLIRSGIIKHPDEYYTWIVDTHHIISDGTSHTILIENFLSLYNDKPLEPLKLQYKDFSQWQDHLFESGIIKVQEDYWLNLYPDAKEIPKLSLVNDYKRPDIFTFAGDNYSFILEREDAVKFKALGSRNGGTLYMNILAALNALFYRYSGQTDIIIGTGIAGRPHADLFRIIGMFVNTLAMRNHPQGEKSYESFLKDVINNSINAFENQDLQFESLIDKLDLERDASRNPLFDMMMVVQNFRPVRESGAKMPAQVQRTQKNEKLHYIEYTNKTSKFDMTFFVYDENDNVYIDVEYYTAIFKRETMARLSQHLQELIKQVISNPGIKLKDIDILTRQEKQQLLYRFNDTGTDYPKESTIGELFEKQTGKTPDHTAVIFGEEHVTYRVLDERSNQAANYLYDAHRVVPDQPVGMLMARCTLMITALVGILKAGGAYVPISPSFPEERIKHMIDDANIKILMSQKQYIKTLNRLQWECKGLEAFLCMDSNNAYFEDELQESQLMSRKLWEYVGETASDEITGGGWNSSYTGNPIPKKEMDEYGDNILKKLQPLLHPQMRVLEIGCASGISMYRIAPLVGLYYGTDLSNTIIEKNKKRIKKQGHKNIKLTRLTAHEIHQLDETGFDLVVINSVIQCFNGHNYLRKVLRKAINLLGSTGYLFIGDIMDQELKEDLTADMVTFKKTNRNKNYKTKTDWSEELFISRTFLEDLAWDYPAIQDMKFSNKIYTIENELTKFRYDALIYIDKTSSKTPSPKRKKTPKHKHQHDLSILGKYGPGKVTARVKPGNTAYIIYTSGSSGIPKGTLTTHYSITRLVKNTNYIDFQPGDRILQLSDYAFDGSTFDIYGALLNGLPLVMVERQNLLEIETLCSLIKRERITVFFVTTALFNTLVDIGRQSLSNIRKILFGGERVSEKHAAKALAYLGKNKILHVYGPTETTVYATYYKINKITHNQITIPIGAPISNTVVYIMDSNSRLVPIGVPGELYIGGDGVSRGYLNNPQLTFEKFINFNRFNRSYVSYRTYILYKTGDLVRWLPDGNIEFIGRIDSQVKVRGFRIELEEIQGRLLSHYAIKECIVTAREDEKGSRYLSAYWIGDETIETAELKNYLSRLLPDFMIPSYFVQMEHFPLTSSNKIDKSKLPDPTLVLDDNYAPPRDEIEKKLVETWSEVLGIGKEMIGINANFFELGGHSLKATILTSKIHKEMKVKVPLVEIFNRQTIRELSQYILHSPTYRYSTIESAEKKEYYPLSAAQKRLYILQQMELDNTHYNMPDTIPLAQEIHKERLEKVFKQLTRRHESFRTSFHMIDGQPVQKIHDEVEFKIDLQVTGAGDRCRTEEERSSLLEGTRGLAPLSTEPAKRSAQSAEHDVQSIEPNKERQARFIRPFDLTQAPLLRVGVIELLHTPTALRGHPSQEGKEGKYLLIIDMHHIISDGTSQEILEREFAALYEGKEPAPLRLQYKDYSQWQNSRRQQEIMKTQEKYWLKEFPGELPILDLPYDYPRPLIQDFEGRRLHFYIKKEITRSLKLLSQKTGTTLYMILLSVFNILLSKLSSQEDIIVGTPIAGRRHADLQDIVGMFVNTLSMRNYPQGDKNFLTFLKEIKKRTLEAYENQEYQFEDLVDKVPVNRDTGRNPLFDVMFNFLNIADLPQDINIQEIDSNAIEDKGDCKAKFDITFQGEEINRMIYFAVDFCTKLYKAETIKRFIIYFKKITLSVVENPGQKISSLDIISPEEKRRILSDLNNTSVEYPKDKTIHQLFAEQVNNTPDNIAVAAPLPVKHRTYMTHMTYISYLELNEKSNLLAHLLKEKGMHPDTIVGIMVQPSIEMIIGILGILKAGGAYLPIHREYPGKRIDYMLKDSGAEILLKDNDLTPEAFNNRPKGTSSHLHLPPAPATSLAYIIYTSGSTGMPKGVIVEHKSLVNLCLWHNNFFSVTSFDRAIKYAGFGFDASVWEIFPYLIKGAAIYVVEEEIKVDIIQLNAYFEKNHITIGFLPTQMCEQFMDVDNQSLRILLTGGDKLKKYIKRDYQLVNNYGPTENTVVATSFIVNGDFMNIPIGKPMDNVRVYILDEESHLQPIGVPGQVCICGESLARGYLNNPELTAEKFNHDFWDDREGYHRSYRSYMSNISNRTYKTGDLARWLQDGNIEFLGRTDHQVKIRGFRIEPAEIENQLLRHDMVKEAVILASQDETGDRYLAAYIVPCPLTPGSAPPGSTPSAAGNPVPFQVSELRKFLSRELPNYMIPTIFIEIGKIPLNASGKIDRKKLPAPKIRIHEEEYTAPRSESEQYLAGIWSEVLGIQKDLIGIDVNFFELGGHSLKALQVVSKLSREFDITLEQMFKYPTIAGLASQLVKKKDNLLKKIQQVKQNLASANDENSNELQLLEKARTRYKSSVIKEELPGLGEERNYRRILVTGVPGYLGMHLVFELLSQTNAHLYLLIRGQSVPEAEKRLSKKSRYYFEPDFYEANQHRLTVLTGDLRDKHLGLPRQQYEELSRTIEAVVHSAANVRHFGRYEDFYEDNVKATENLLEFTLAGQQKDFHHISTLSVGSGNIEGKKTMLFTEYCHDVGQEPDNVYIKTKLEAEKKVLAYSRKGLNASIYRVGNLVAHSETGKFQENIDDNAFYASIKTYISLGMLPHEEEIWADLTFIDQAAEALVVLITKTSLCNETFHLHNTCKLSINTLTKHLRKQGITIKIVSIEQFLDYLADHIDDRDKRMIIDRFLLHWGILGNEKQETINMIVSDRTQWILRRLNFEWKEVTMEYMVKMINNCRFH